MSTISSHQPKVPSAVVIITSEDLYRDWVVHNIGEFNGFGFVF